MALLIAAAVSWLGLMLTQIDGYDWPDSALVKANGRPHVVQLDEGGTALLWTYETGPVSDCTVTDLATGRALATRPTDGTYRREGGSAGDWVGKATFAPTSDLTYVTCASTSARPVHLVPVEDAPTLPPALASVGAPVVVPLSLATAGLLALVGAVTRAAFSRAGRKATTT